jgi:hypothetical protein
MIDSHAHVDKRLVDAPLPAQVDGHSGYPADKAREDTPEALRFAAGNTVREFPKAYWIEPKDWAAKAKENDENHTWPINYIDRFTNQSPTHECTCHSLRANMEAARNRQRGIFYPEGPKKAYRYPDSARGSVWLSPMSVYAEANPGQWGGAGIVQVLEIAVRRGMLPEKTQPREYGFKHALAGTTGEGGLNQSTGKWTKVSDFPAGWEETGGLFKPEEVVFAETLEQAVCLILHGVVYSVGRSGHAVPWAQFNVTDRVFPYVDSYDVVRYDSWNTARSAYSGGFGVMTLRAPSGNATWENPAGIAI